MGLLTLGAALLLRVFVLDAYRIPTDSMADTLLPGDVVLVNKLLYGARLGHSPSGADRLISAFRMPGFRDPARGDILAFHAPQKKGVVYVKRCVAVPGDTLSLRDGTLFVNGLPVPLPSGGRGAGRDAAVRLSPSPTGHLVVPGRGLRLEADGESRRMWGSLLREEEGGEGGFSVPGYDYYFVLGDNRPRSRDSRSWGFVREDAIVGSPFLIIWSREPVASRSPFAHLRLSRVGTLLR
ncbi:MAG: signal peptidase I [Bacteroidota bacterium]